MEQTQTDAEGLPVSGAVHGLQSKDVLLHGEGEHVLTVVLPVARGLPQLAVVDIRRRHFLEASPAVLLLCRQFRAENSRGRKTKNRSDILKGINSTTRTPLLSPICNHLQFYTPLCETYYETIHINPARTLYTVCRKGNLIDLSAHT